MTELVPQSFRELLDFYTDCYPDARFGDLDVTALHQALAELEASAAAVEEAESALARAREDFGNAEAAVLGKAARALSFLKIHVEGNASQSEQLEAIGAELSGQRRRSKLAADNSAAILPEARQRRTRRTKSVGANAGQSTVVNDAEQAALQRDDEAAESLQARADSLGESLLAPGAAAE